MSHESSNEGGENMRENVIPIRKVDRFFLTKGFVTKAGEVVEKERVGVAYLKPGSSLFRLRLWTFPEGEFFLAREASDNTRYVALCREEFVASGDLKNHWHKIGTGEVIGNFVRIRFHLISEDIYLCLFPSRKGQEVIDVA